MSTTPAEPSPEPGTPVLIIGPSAVGKTAILEAALARTPGSAKLITTTTRAIRPGEVDGVHYHFCDRPEFERRLARGEFMEHNEFNAQLYGSSKVVLEAMQRKHQLVLSILDVNGARAVQQIFPACLSVFILPESLAQLEVRHLKRGVPAAEMAWRLKRAEEEIAQAGDFDVQVTNHEDRMAHAVSEVLTHAALARAAHGFGLAFDRT